MMKDTGIKRKGYRAMKFKKIMSLLLTGTLLASVLTGCGGAGAANGEVATQQEENGSGQAEDISQQESTEAPAETVKLQVWGAVAEEYGPQEMVDAFNAEHDDIQVEYVLYTNDDAGNTKLDMSLMAGGDADLFFSYNDTYLQKRVEAGNTLGLKEMLDAQGFDPVEAFGEGVTAYETDGEYYMMPTVTSNDCILYNKKMFDEAGIDYPNPGWDYEEFIAAAEALTKDGVYGYFYPAWGAGQPATDMAKRALGNNWMYNEDGSAVQIDKPEVKQSFQAYMDRVADGIEVDFVDSATQKMSSQDMLLQGKAAMVYGNWIVRYVTDTENYPHDFVTGFATVPKLSSGQDVLYTGSLGDYLSINSKSEHPEAAMEFMQWYIKGGINPLAKYGRIPAYSGIDRGEIVELAFGENADLFDMEEAQSVFLTSGDVAPRTVTAASSEIDTVLTEEFEKAFAGEQTVEEAIAAAQERAQKQFEEVTAE